MSYQDAVIYTITSGDDLYVGSTRNFTKRWGTHKSNITNKNSHEYNKKLYQVIRENKNDWNMTIHHAFPCDTKQQLREEEQRTIDELKPTLNECRAYRTEEEKKEYDKQYRLVNKEQCRKLTNQWKEDNKEILKKKKAEWYENNKDKIAQQAAEKITCECGAIIRRDSLARHKKSKKHLNYCPVILTQ